MNKRIKLLLMGAGLVVFAAVVWFLVLSPIRGDIASLNTQIQDEQTQLMSAQTKLDQAEATRGEGRRNQARLLELAKLMPAEEEIPSLLLQIQDLADSAGIEFIAISPGDTEDSEFADARILPLSLEFQGTYFCVTDFIYRAEKMASGPGRLLMIKELSLEPRDTGSAAGVSPELGVTMTMYAFLQGGGTTAAKPPASSGSKTTTTTTAATTNPEQ
jgi:Tfp pilus assembly protein PilO